MKFFSELLLLKFVSISASSATIRMIEERGTIEHINAMGIRLKDGYNEIAKSQGLSHLTEMIGYGWWLNIYFMMSRGIFLFGDSVIGLQQEIVRRGILIRAGIFLRDRTKFRTSTKH